MGRKCGLGGAAGSKHAGTDMTSYNVYFTTQYTDQRTINDTSFAGELPLDNPSVWMVALLMVTLNATFM
jgi:hypothetical protein